MTTFHESQPQSRRAARQSERNENGEREEGAGQAEFTGQEPAAPQVYSPADAPAGVREDAPGSPVGGPEVSKGRRAAAPAGPPSAAAEAFTATAPLAAAPPVSSEPLTYRTQQRTPVPSYDGPGFLNRGPAPADVVAPADATAQANGTDDMPPTQVIDQIDRPAYRVRDYSPEGRRSAPMAAAAGAVDAAAGSTSATEGTLPVSTAHSDIFRQGAPRPQFFVPESALADTIVPGMVRPAAEEDNLEDASTELPSSAIIPEHTMTRRELRALEAQAALAASAQSVPALPEFAPDGSLTGAAAAVFVETDFGDEKDDEKVAPATDDDSALAPGSIDEAAADDAAAVDEVPSVTPSLSPFDALFAVPSARPAQDEAQAAAPAQTQDEPAVDSGPAPLVEPLLPATAPAPSDGPELTDALAEFDSLTSAPADAEAGTNSSDTAAEPDTGSTWIAPVGHWSAQEDVDDDVSGEGNISRTVSSGMSTTSALVLPSIPDGADIRGPLTMTGEIRLTGSIDLPHTLSATGQSDRFDGENMDALFDLNDAEVISTDSSPVRAIRAVSTHTSGHGVTHTQKPKGTKALTGLLIAASSLAVAVAGLLVAAFAFNVF